MPPSWTIHHTSMWPSVKRSPLDGKAEMFFGTSRAKLATVVSLTSSAEQADMERLRCVGYTASAFLFWMFSDKPKWQWLISISDFILYMSPCFWQYFCSFFLPSNQPMKFLQCWCSSPCFQLRGHETKTALCFRPPSPLAWSRCDVASRRLEDTVTWQKPFTFSVSISLRSA